MWLAGAGVAVAVLAAAVVVWAIRGRDGGDRSGGEGRHEAGPGGAHSEVSGQILGVRSQAEPLSIDDLEIVGQEIDPLGLAVPMSEAEVRALQEEAVALSREPSPPDMEDARREAAAAQRQITDAERQELEEFIRRQAGKVIP